MFYGGGVNRLDGATSNNGPGYFGNTTGTNGPGQLLRNYSRPRNGEHPFSELTEMITGQTKLISDAMQQNTSLVKLCQEVKSDVAKLRKEVNDMKENVTCLNSKVDGKWCHTKKPRKKLPTDLTKRVRDLHSTLEFQFIGEEQYNSKHNHAVATQIIEQISNGHGEKYDVDEIRLAAHRYYESRRRIYNDAQPKRQEQVKRNKETTQRRGFRKRLYERRMKMVKNKRERDYWSQITYEYMTEESEDEIGNVRRHKLSWTSHSLQKLKHKLDERLKAREMSSGRFKAMERIESTISSLSPPIEPVKWAVSLTSSGSEAVVVESSDNSDSTAVATPLSIENTPPGRDVCSVDDSGGDNSTSRRVPMESSSSTSSGEDSSTPRRDVVPMERSGGDNSTPRRMPMERSGGDNSTPRRDVVPMERSGGDNSTPRRDVVQMGSIKRVIQPPMHMDSTLDRLLDDLSDESEWSSPDE